MSRNDAYVVIGSDGQKQIVGEDELVGAMKVAAKKPMMRQLATTSRGGKKPNDPLASAFDYHLDLHKKLAWLNSVVMDHLRNGPPLTETQWSSLITPINRLVDQWSKVKT